MLVERDPQRRSELPRAIVFFEARVAEHAGRLALATRLSETEPLEWPAGGGSELDAPHFPLYEVTAVASSLREAATLALLEHDAAACAHSLDRLLTLADRTTAPPYFIGFLLRALFLDQVLAAITSTAGVLAEEDARSLLARLETHEPWSNVLHALRGERAIANRRFAAMQAEIDRQGSSDAILGEVVHTVGVHQREYLDLMAVAVDGLESGVPWAELAERHELARSELDSAIALALVPELGDLLEFVAVEEVRWLQAQAALRARLDGPDAALAWWTGRDDPFGAGGMHGRTEDDGALTLWSVGPNGSDDGGRGEPVSEGPLDLVRTVSPGDR